MTTNNDKIAALITDAVDRSSDGGGREPLETPELRAELETAQSAQALLTTLEQQPVPNQFMARVTQRVRRRTAGRYFHPADRPFGMMVSIDAFIVLAVAVMAACWFLIKAPTDPAPKRLDPPSPIEAPKTP